MMTTGPDLAHYLILTGLDLANFLPSLIFNKILDIYLMGFIMLWCFCRMTWACSIEKCKTCEQFILFHIFLNLSILSICTRIFTMYNTQHPLHYHSSPSLSMAFSLLLRLLLFQILLLPLHCLLITMLSMLPPKLLLHLPLVLSISPQWTDYLKTFPSVQTLIDVNR